MNQFHTSMYGEKGPVPDRIIDGRDVDYPDTDLADWHHLHYEGNDAHFQVVKQRRVPLNICNHRKSIEPLEPLV